MANSTGTREIAPDMTVHQVLESFPDTLGVFNVYGIDSCCGGGIPVADAARRHGIDPGELMDALRRGPTDAPGA